jgi:tRNA threonylcarbamoyl adenosine modification protein (Sua5/YciO/YrdC/YwlC family)
MPTDTVYGVAADAFNAAAVQKLVDAKGRTRASPPPVLIPGIPTLDALAEMVPDEVRELVAKYWPGALTIIVQARSSLTWDLGDTKGTVALRMPSNRIALELLSETGPLAVSSANRTGRRPATTAAEAEAMLGDSVAIYLDGGPGGTVASTIVDATGLGSPEGKLRIVREGVIPAAEIRELVGVDKCHG